MGLFGTFLSFPTSGYRRICLPKYISFFFVESGKHTQIYYKGDYIDFPFQKNIHQLDKEELIDCLYDLFSVNQGSIRSFKEMVYANYGKSIAEKFLIPYNEKLYACDLDRLDMNAMGRFSQKQIRKILSRIFVRKIIPLTIVLLLILKAVRWNMFSLC